MITNLIVGLVLVLALGIFGVYASLAVRHAIRFRSISKRAVYLTLGFLCLSTTIIVMSFIAYGFLILS